MHDIHDHDVLNQTIDLHGVVLVAEVIEEALLVQVGKVHARLEQIH